MCGLFVHMFMLCVLTVDLNSGFIVDCVSKNDCYKVYTNLPANKTQVKEDSKNGSLALTLNHQNLTNITQDIIDIMPWLTSIDLSHNRINYLPQDVFRNASCLLRVNLRLNNIGHLPSGLLGSPDRPMKINVFDVSHNNITTVDLDLFHKELRNLKIVNLSYNNLEYFETWPYLLNPSGGTKCCIFDLSHNKIEKCRNTKKMNITNLSGYRVDVTSNKISDVPTCFHEIFPQLDANFINLDMDLRDNPITCNCTMYKLINILKDSLFQDEVNDTLTCENPLHLQNKTFREILENPAVLQCEVTERCPSNCSCFYTPAENLTTVDCSMVNTFSELPKELPNNAHILLNMSDNRLVKLTGRRYIPRLITLDVSFNQIVSIDENFFQGVSQMEYLNMSHNLITALPTTIRNLKFSRVRLEDNLLQCTCESRWMKNWVQSTGEIHTQILQCELDGSRQNMTTALINLKCGYQSIVIAISLSVLGVLVIFSVITICMACVWKYETNVITYYVCGARPFKVEETTHEGEGHKYDLYIAFNESNKCVRNWVRTNLLPWFEKRKKPVSSYYSIRDQPCGDVLSDVMIEALNESRKILIIIDKSYADDEWFMGLINITHNAHYRKMIILLFNCAGTVCNQKSRQIESYVSQNLYIKLGEKLFWPKLYYRLWT